MIKLKDLKISEHGIIKDMSGLNIDFRHRLLDMGVYPNSELTLVKRIANGKLLIIDIDDVEFCLRSRDAEKILIERVTK